MRRPLFLLTALLLPAALHAQQPWTPARLTADDYARAERFLSAGVAGLTSGADVRPVWLDGDRFWYRNTLPEGAEFVLVDAERGSREPAFDHARLAEALAGAMGRSVAPFDLPFRAFEMAGEEITFEVEGGRWACHLGSYRCARAGGERTGAGAAGAAGAAAGAPPNSVLSPDGARAAFVRDHDLWVRELATGTETRLTTDGVEDYGYATNNAGWTRSDRPVVLWSPDSRRIATFQHDGRGVGEMYLTSTNVGHPELEAWKYPLPEDSVIFRIRRVVVDLDAAGRPRVVPLQMPPDQHRSTVCDHIVCGGGWADIEWTPDSERLVFVSSSRDHKVATVRVADAATGAMRDVFTETVPTFFESGANWRVLPETNELLWYSAHRSGWGHLYLFDLETGRLKNAVTQGDWAVQGVVRLDPGSRTVWFMGAGRELGDPYFQYLYSVRLDGSNLQLLTPDSAHHSVTLSPSGAYFVDARSTPVDPPVAELRRMDGRLVRELERGDVTGLVAYGWQPPTPFTVKARDGVTDLYGLMYTPTSLDENRRYPIINYIYPGPQSASVGSRSFTAARRDHQAMAELGFVVVALDGMGTPGRSQAYHEAYYGNMGDNGLPDQVSGMRQLAARYPFIDLERAGIWGHSGGGFASTAAILQYPDFFKVAVSQAGNHDNRNYEDDWGEKWQGLLSTNMDGTGNYDNQANQLLADRLEGKLLLAHGTMDNNVPPSNTLLMVDALIAANKDFDLIMFPNRRHGFGNEPYMMRRRWDYFVEHLLGAEPPREYTIGAGR